MRGLVGLLLAQSLNLNQAPILCMDEGLYCSTTRRAAFELNCSGTGVTCTQTAGRMTVSVSGGGGGGSGSGGAPVDGGYVTFSGGTTGSTNERSLTAGTNIAISTATPGQVSIGVTGTVASATSATTATQLASDPAACGAGNYVTDISASGVLTCSTPPGTYVLPDSTSTVTGGVRLTGDLGGTATSPSVVDDSHAHTGSTISGLDVGDITTGTLSQARGGSGAGALTCSSGQALFSNGTAYTCTSTLTANAYSGTLPIANGGTNGTATPTAGGMVYGTGSAYAVTAAGTGGDCLKSGGAGAPTWGSCSSISAYGTIDDEGTPLTQRTALNFAGAGVTCVDNAGASQTDCTIPGGPTVRTARTTGTHTVGATTATEVTALQVTLAGAGTYDVRYHLRARSSATGNGYKYGVNVTANLSSLVCVARHPTTGSTATTGIGDGVQATLTGGIMEVLGAANAASTTAANMGPNTGVASTTETIPVLIDCSIVTSGAGDLELWMGSEAAVNVTTEANSYVVVTTVP